MCSQRIHLFALPIDAHHTVTGKTSHSSSFGVLVVARIVGYTQFQAGCGDWSCPQGANGVERLHVSWAVPAKGAHRRVRPGGEYPQAVEETSVRLLWLSSVITLTGTYLATLVITAMDGKSSKPIIIAHRGASGYLPEHTAPAVAVAVALDADYVEPDVVLTKDGTPIVLHDIYLDSVTNVAELFPDRKRQDGRYYAVDFTLDEIKRLKVHERIDLRTGRRVYPQRFPKNQTDLRILTFAEWLELIQGINQSMSRDVGICPEIKNPAWHRQHNLDISTIVLTTLSRYGYRDRHANCYLQCFDGAELRRLRNELNSDLKLIQLFTDDAWRTEAGALDEQRAQTDLASGAGYCVGIGCDLRSLVTIAPDGKVMPNGIVAEAHRLGLLVHAYSFRRDALPEFAPSYEELVRLFVQQVKVDGLFTDFPDLTRNILCGNLP